MSRRCLFSVGNYADHLLEWPGECFVMTVMNGKPIIQGATDNFSTSFPFLRFAVVLPLATRSQTKSLAHPLHFLCLLHQPAVFLLQCSFHSFPTFICGQRPRKTLRLPVLVAQWLTRSFSSAGLVAGWIA